MGTHELSPRKFMCRQVLSCAGNDRTACPVTQLYRAACRNVSKLIGVGHQHADHTVWLATTCGESLPQFVLEQCHTHNLDTLEVKLSGDCRQSKRCLQRGYLRGGLNGGALNANLACCFTLLAWHHLEGACAHLLGQNLRPASSKGSVMKHQVTG